MMINTRLNSVNGYNTRSGLHAHTNAAKKSNFVKKSEVSTSENELVELNQQFEAVQKEQGILGKAWNGLKNTVGLGLSSNDVEKAINDYKNGKISYEQASQTIAKFDAKQEGAVNIISNLATGVATAALAVGTGGLSLGVAAAGAGIGAVSKAGLKTLDRATNELKGDALDAKQIAKDGLSGAIDGAVSVATSGMVKGATVNQTVMQTVKQGAVQGAKAGAISGAAAGAGDYAIEAAFEDDIEFNASDLFAQSAQSAVVEGIFGGVLGGIGGGIAQNKLNHSGTNAQLNNSAKHLSDTYRRNSRTLKMEYGKLFDDVDNLAKISTRSKGQSSIYSKLSKKYDKGNFSTIDLKNCADQIGDGYGIRIQLKSLEEKDANAIIKNALDGTGKTYDDFVNALNKNETLSGEYIAVIDELKEAQTNKFVNSFIDGIKTKKIILSDEPFNNYGDELTSYFTDKQLKQIGKAYYETTGKQMKFVSKNQKSLFDTADNISFDKSQNPVVNKAYKDAMKRSSKAVKESGYTDVQMNISSTKTNGNLLADSELQLRGEEVNVFAESEHKFYDTNTGKISLKNASDKNFYKAVRGMDDESKKVCLDYLGENYKFARLKELGITGIEKPVLSGKLHYASADVLKERGLEGLVNPNDSFNASIISDKLKAGRKTNVFDFIKQHIL